jgi:hypothetical protein
VTLSLEKLGQQVFSSEPGGYSFENWMKSLNLLLDDFEAIAGVTNLPQQYFQKREEVTKDLLKPAIDIFEIESQVAEVREEEVRTNAKIRDLESRIISSRNLEISSKIAELKEDRKQYSMELKREKNKLLLLIGRREESRAGRGEKGGEERGEVNVSSSSSSVSLFRRLFSFRRSPSRSDNDSKSNPLTLAEVRIGDLEGKITAVDDEISNLESERNAEGGRMPANIGSYEFELRKEKKKLEEIRSRLFQLEAMRLEKMQLSERRRDATKMLSEMISQINLSNTNKKTSW